ncbi:MAG: UDP-N-acetylmuramoyl-L-alanine--D-glutamate ligase [Acidobacteriota bacterium]
MTEGAMTFSVRGSHAVVVGGGDSGSAAASLLVDHGARVTLTDVSPTIRSEQQLRALGVNLALGGHPSELLAGADLIVLSPGVSLALPQVATARAAGVPVISEVELASRWLRGRVVAITGTKGKSTTTALTGRMLIESGRHALVGGNIGTPLASQVALSRPETIHVVEVSSFQLEGTSSFHPMVAAVLNLTPDHLDRHGTFAAYAAAKARVFASQTADDWAVINADDPGVLDLARRTPAARVTFSLAEPDRADIAVESGWIVDRRTPAPMPLVAVTDIRLMGRHLLADVLAASAIARVLDLAPDPIRSAVAGFRGLEHAMEAVGDVGGIAFVNDSKATNVASALQAIDTFGPGLVVIMGGRFKGGRFADLRPSLVERRASVVVIGESRHLINDALRPDVPVHEADSMAEAVRLAWDAAPPGGTVLLAPACASFDMFENYAARGLAFKAETERLRREIGERRKLV